MIPVTKVQVRFHYNSSKQLKNCSFDVIVFRCLWDCLRACRHNLHSAAIKMAHILMVALCLCDASLQWLKCYGALNDAHNSIAGGNRTQKSWIYSKLHRAPFDQLLVFFMGSVKKRERRIERQHREEIKGNQYTEQPWRGRMRGLQSD